MASIRPYVEPCFGCGNLSNFSRQLQLYYFHIAITIAIIIAIYRLYLAFGTACVAGPCTRARTQKRHGRHLFAFPLPQGGRMVCQSTRNRRFSGDCRTGLSFLSTPWPISGWPHDLNPSS